MKAKRKPYDSEFKARVALEALKGERTIQQIAKEYEVHPVPVSEWKKRMAQGASEVLEGGGKKSQESDFDRERDNLHRKIGQLSVELDWLRKSPSNSVCEGSERVGGQRESQGEHEKALQAAVGISILGRLQV